MPNARLMRAIYLPILKTTSRSYTTYTPMTESRPKYQRFVRPKRIFADVQVIYQTVENLHIACPKNLGDWYFTGDYPTPGGTRVANKAFMNYMEGIDGRAY
jgi:amidophosphoribosyltransferase